jgi:hypothetical protein
MEVPAGQTVGGTFAHLPVCTQPDETGCVVGYRSYAAGGDAIPGRGAPSPGHESICVNPAELARGKAAPFSRAFLGAQSRFFPTRGTDGVKTPFVMLRDLYTGRCESGPGGFRYLAVAVTPGPGDVRVSPIDLDNHWLHGELGLHLLDMQLTQGDLVDLVARRAGALRSPDPGGHVLRNAP